MSTHRPVILLTDFGIDDEFAGVCHGVVLARAPGTYVVHLTHGIAPQAVGQGAIVLRNTLPYMPVGVHLAVVDPGVGTQRRGVALECADGRAFVGPDNGLLFPAVQVSGGAVAAVSLESEAHRLTPVAPTFHGRDVFAPAAAHLAAGGALSDLGPSIEPASLQQLNIPKPRSYGEWIEADVWNVDRYGNIALLLDEPTLRSVVGDARQVELIVRNDHFYATLAGTFANVRVGEILIYVDPYGSMSVAVNQGAAADMFRLEVGQSLTIRAAAEPTP